MKTEQLALFLISPDSTVVEAMQRIDRNARGILFVTNEQQKLLGVVTDGDIRRWLIRTGELKAPVSGLMNTEPKRISRKEHANAHAFMVQHSITALPVVTTKGVVSDILFRDEKVAKKKKPQGILKEVPVVIMAGGKGTFRVPSPPKTSPQSTFSGIVPGTINPSSSFCARITRLPFLSI